MPKKEEGTDEYMISDTGNWNIASDFAREMIAKPMIKCSIFEDVAKFGYESLMDELMGFAVPDNLIRYTGLKRLIEELIKLCNNSRFAMKKQGTEKELIGYRDQLKKLKKVLEGIKKVKKDAYHKSEKLEFDEIKFQNILELVIDIKSDINDPLNRNHLIFTDKEEFDPVAFKERLKHRMINKG